MLIKRISSNSEGIISLYESSNIYASKFKNNELTVIFKTGSVYKYEDVNNVDFTLFETAESQGKVLNSKIKSKTFYKLDDVNLDEIDNLFAESDEQDITNANLLLWGIIDKMSIDRDGVNKDILKVNLNQLKETADYLLKLLK